MSDSEAFVKSLRHATDGRIPIKPEKLADLNAGNRLAPQVGVERVRWIYSYRLPELVYFETTSHDMTGGLRLRQSISRMASHAIMQSKTYTGSSK